MNISFLIPAIVLYTVRVAFSNSVQVGTVLFTTTDLVRKCWTDYDKSLLKARAIMQDVLPDPDCLDFSNPEAIVILLDYFQACYQIISTSTYGKVQNLMYVALSDAFGGYLRAHVLPFVRRSYYGGVMKYSEAQKLFLLYDDVRSFLKTDGRGWAPPGSSHIQAFRVKPLVITGGTAEACKDLYIIEKQGKEHVIPPDYETSGLTEEKFPCGRGEQETPLQFENFRLTDVIQPFHKSVSCLNPWNQSNVLSTWGCGEREGSPLNSASNSAKMCRKKGKAEKGEKGGKEKCGKCGKCGKYEKGEKGEKEKEEEEEKEEREESEEEAERPPIKTVVVPLPVLDDQETPNSIAVPFKKRPFRNLKSGSSANILETYYASVIKCFLAKGNTRTDIGEFNARFHSWLMTKVIPRLKEEQFYPGFGGVLKVVETIKMFGGENDFRGPEPQDYGFLFDEGAEFGVDPSFIFKGKYKARDICDVEDDSPPMKRYLIAGISVVATVMFILTCCCIIYCQLPKRPKDGTEDTQFQMQPENNFMKFKFFGKLFRSKPKETSFTQEQTTAVYTYTPGEVRDPYCNDLQAWPQGYVPGYYSQQAAHFCTHQTKHPFERRAHHVQTLWKKPSNLLNSYWTSGYDMDESKRKYSTVSLTGSDGRSSSCTAAVEDETKCYSTEVRTITGNSTGSCHCTVLTDSSGTKKAKKRKSTTVTIYDMCGDYNRKRNYSTKSSSQCSTTESGSEGFCSSECSTCKREPKQ